MKNIDLSIIIPAFNAQSTIVNTLESIIKQDCCDVNYEIIIIDDGSIDNTESICIDFMNVHKNKNIRFFSSQKNFGVSYARNMGIEKALGRKIIFLDSDDQLLDVFFKNIKGNLTNDLVFFNYRSVRNDMVVHDYKIMDYSYKDLNDFLSFPSNLDIINPICGKIFDKNIIMDYCIRFDTDEKFGEDSLFIYHYLRYVRDFSIISSFLQEINIANPKGLSRNYYDLFGISIKLLNALRYLLLNKSSRDNIVIKIIKNYLIHSLIIGKSTKSIISELKFIRSRLLFDIAVSSIVSLGGGYNYLVGFLFSNRLYLLLIFLMKCRTAVL